MATRRPAQRPPAPRARILEAALATFADRGAEAASIADVAARAGMSKQALMHYFRTKELLRQGVYQDLARRLRELFPEVAAELLAGGREYGRAIELVARQLAANQAVARFMLHELLSQPEKTADWLRAETAPWLGLVTGVVDQHRLRTRGAAPRGKKASRRPPHDGIDADAHVTVLVGAMLSVSALVPRGDPRWWRRVNAALLRVLRLGSHLEGSGPEAR
jgi:AcrR family transcriptional regulator